MLAYSGSAVGLEYLRRWQIGVTPVGDMEEILADPAVEAVIVAGKPADRPAQLRRALQSERHVLCVHPADDSPDIAYEAAMMQGDTNKVLFPLLAEGLHPAVARLAQLLGNSGLLLLEMEHWSTEAVLLETATPGHEPALPGWDVLRKIGGEIVEIVGLAPTEEVRAEDPLLVAGRFERGGLFQTSFLPMQADPRWRLSVRTAVNRLHLEFPEGWPGPARLIWHDEHGVPQEESWEAWNPWAALVENLDEVLAKGNRRAAGQAIDLVTWQKEIRCLELDAAARSSVERRRASTLEYQEATEEASFKGTMTLVGCALVWGSLVLLLLSAWVPLLGWMILPFFGVFLLLQLLRWVVPPKPTATAVPSPVESSNTPVPPAASKSTDIRV